MGIQRSIRSLQAEQANLSASAASAQELADMNTFSGNGGCGSLHGKFDGMLKDCQYPLRVVGRTWTFEQWTIPD